MKSKVKSKRLTAKKNKENFLQWLKKRNALKKEAAEDENIKPDQFIEKALMVWADDGGLPD